MGRRVRGHKQQEASPPAPQSQALRFLLPPYFPQKAAMDSPSRLASCPVEAFSSDSLDRKPMDNAISRKAFEAKFDSFTNNIAIHRENQSKLSVRMHINVQAIAEHRPSVQKYAEQMQSILYWLHITESKLDVAEGILLQECVDCRPVGGVGEDDLVTFLDCWIKSDVAFPAFYAGAGE
ncbi:hypothetical protein NDU88_002762 [Pleurodeles waltl]|uniref:Uncharacterized protein n=1 Tax=Pleurodeles waltl TaxID=8319 RepID=A0AAV7T469_PLEWA|nr:hypothetical protein NDU88_002762 [Pleurodeles waltl]